MLPARASHLRFVTVMILDSPRSSCSTKSQHGHGIRVFSDGKECLASILKAKTRASDVGSTQISCSLALGKNTSESTA
eukprot:422590-Hanusia_phi.AAC.2